MSEKCEVCLVTFRNLKYHQEHGKQCKKYKYILFTCQCGFSTRGLTNINTHIDKCDNTVEPVNNPIEEQQKKSETIKQNNDLITLLKIERFKNSLLTHIIEKNTSIHIDDIIVEGSRRYSRV